MEAFPPHTPGKACTLHRTSKLFMAFNHISTPFQGHCAYFIPFSFLQNLAPKVFTVLLFLYLP